MSSGPQAVAAALPHYEIGPELGRGGFGIVYAGRQRRLGREVAIKQLPPAFANDAEIRERFVTEARVLASLDHPHIVPVYDYVEQDGLCLLVMECLNGGSVWDTFRREGLSHSRACVTVIAAAAGLHHAHSHGVLHRDVKPENLLLTSKNHLKVTDFGIAKVIGGTDAVATTDGGILGTPAYMAPEQASGGQLSAAADVYAAGVMLYELLSGTLPFSQDGGGIAIVYRHLYEDPIPLQQTAPNVPAPVAEVVMRALVRDPGMRFGSAEEFAVALGEAAEESFGQDWYSQSGLRVVGSDTVMTTLSGSWRGRRATSGTISVPPQGGQELVPRPYQPPVPVDRQPTIHPRVLEHVVGEVSLSAKPQPLVPVRRLFDVPSAPVNLTMAAAVLGVLTLLAAFLGLATSADHSSSLSSHVTVAGTDVTSATDASADLGKDVPVQISPAPAKHVAAHLSLSLDGVPIGSSDTTKLASRGGVATGQLKLGSVRHLVAGPVKATLTLSHGKHELGSQVFQLSPTGSGFISIPGIVIVLALLFVLAYLESLIRPLWRFGRYRVHSGIGLAGMGVLLGVVLTGMGWVLGRFQPNLVTAVVAAVLGAAFAVVTGMAAAKWGLRVRVRRINRRSSVPVAALPA